MSLNADGQVDGDVFCRGMDWRMRKVVAARPSQARLFGGELRLLNCLLRVAAAAGAVERQGHLDATHERRRKEPMSAVLNRRQHRDAQADLAAVLQIF